MLQRNQTHRRPGYAPLELVLALPFLVVLAGMIYTIGAASLTRGQVTVRARNAAWQEVPNQPANRLDYWATTPASGTPVITASPDPTVGIVHGKSWERVKSFAGKAVPAGQLATAETHVLRQSWDYRTIPIVANAPLLPSDQLKDFVKDELDFLTNLNNLKYLIQAVNPSLNGVSLQDLQTLVKDLDNLKDDASDIARWLYEGFDALPNVFKAGDRFGKVLGKIPDVVKNGVEVAGITQKIANATNNPTGGWDKTPTSVPGLPSVTKIVKLVAGLEDKFTDAIKQLPGAVTGVVDVINKMTKSNDY